MNLTVHYEVTVTPMRVSQAMNSIPIKSDTNEFNTRKSDTHTQVNYDPRQVYPSQVRSGTHTNITSHKFNTKSDTH